MTTIHKYIATAALAVLPLCVAAQTNGSNSPYSRYGFGLLGDGGNAFNKGMSGTAYAMRNGKEINTKIQPRMPHSIRSRLSSTSACRCRMATLHKMVKDQCSQHVG